MWVIPMVEPNIPQSNEDWVDDEDEFDEDDFEEFDEDE